MKFRRFLSLFTILIISSFVFTGCIIIPQHKYYSISPDEVASVQIYDLRASETYYGDFIEKDNPIYTLSEDSAADFLDELSEIQFKDSIIITIAAVDPSFTYDEWVARINYTNGSYDLISCDGYGQSYNENNELTDTNHYGCDNEKWKELIIGYLPEDFINNVKQVD